MACIMHQHVAVAQARGFKTGLMAGYQVRYVRRHPIELEHNNYAKTFR